MFVLQLTILWLAIHIFNFVLPPVSCHTLSRLRKCVIFYSTEHRPRVQHFHGANCDGSVFHTEGAWRWPEDIGVLIGGPQWFGEHCSGLCSVIWTDILFEPKLPTRAQMHFWSPAEYSSESGWAEVVVQGTIPKKNKLLEWLSLKKTDRSLVFVHISAMQIFFVFNFESSKLEVIKMFKRTT